MVSRTHRGEKQAQRGTAMKTTLVGSLVTVAVSVMLMVDVPVKANDPKAKEHMMRPVNGRGAASKAMGREELRNTMRMLWEEHIGPRTCSTSTWNSRPPKWPPG